MTSSQPPFHALLNAMQTNFSSGATRSYESRLQALTQLEKMVKENTDAVCRALFADLHKPKQESLIAEVSVVLDEIRLAKKNLRQWMSPKTVKTPLTLWPAKSGVHPEPLGTVLIIAPWNYPFMLAIAPLIGALAAGNCTVIKPSELSTMSSKLIFNLISQYFQSNHVAVVEGGVPETTALLNLKFDHIFFTGSTAVGKIVMQAAAKNLIPVTLELGGKSPTVVTEDADLDLAARRIVWGKYYNAGQTCVAPDYLYVHKSVETSFLQKLKAQILTQFSDSPKHSQSYGRIVNDKNCQRLADLIDHKQVAHGGQVDSSIRFIAPTLLTNISWTDAVMQEEIFGPLLPIMTYENLDEVFKTINSKPKPLAAYFFSQSKEKQNSFTDKVTFGGGCINDTLVHLGNPYLSFGGVGDSGMGRYHGESSFKTFSHEKSVMHRRGVLDIAARYAPYTTDKLKLMRRIFGV